MVVLQDIELESIVFRDVDLSIIQYLLFKVCREVSKVRDVFLLLWQCRISDLWEERSYIGILLKGSADLLRPVTEGNFDGAESVHCESRVRSRREISICSGLRNIMTRS